MPVGRPEVSETGRASSIYTDLCVLYACRWKKAALVGLQDEFACVGWHAVLLVVRGELGEAGWGRWSGKLRQGCILVSCIVGVSIGSMMHGSRGASRLGWGWRYNGGISSQVQLGFWAGLVAQGTGGGSDPGAAGWQAEPEEGCVGLPHPQCSSAAVSRGALSGCFWGVLCPGALRGCFLRVLFKAPP